MKQLSAKLKSRGATAVVLTLALGAAVYLNWSFSREAPPSLVVSDTAGEAVETSAQARTDAQTGALNRRGLDEALEQEVKAAQKTGAPLCVALLDLDDFKNLNDRLGHDAGDKALEHLVHVAKKIMRTQDQLARYGGEEFVFLLPDTTATQAVEVMKRLQRTLTAQYFLQDNERVLITFSAGVTDYRTGDTQTTLTKRADEAMYQAKESGRNGIRLQSSQHPDRGQLKA